MGHHLLAHMTVHSAISSIGAYSYLAVFFLTLLSGHLIPIPEEVVLLIIGYAAGTGAADLRFAIAAAIAGLLAGDSVLYALGHHGGRLIGKVEHRLPRATLQRYADRLDTRPVATIIAMRFVSGLRIFSPIFAGAWRIPFKTFVLADLCALCVYVPLVTGLGYAFNNALGVLIGGFSIVRHLVFLGLLALLGAFFAHHAYHMFFAAAQTEEPGN